MTSASTSSGMQEVELVGFQVLLIGVDPACLYKHLAIGCQSQLMCVGPHDLASVSTIVR